MILITKSKPGKKGFRSRFYNLQEGDTSYFIRKRMA
jgi:hypothetical protein